MSLRSARIADWMSMASTRTCGSISSSSSSLGRRPGAWPWPALWPSGRAGEAGTGERGTGDGAAEDGAAEDGAAEDGAAEDGAAEDGGGAAEDGGGAAEDGGGAAASAGSGRASATGLAPAPGSRAAAAVPLWPSVIALPSPLTVLLNTCRTLLPAVQRGAPPTPGAVALVTRSGARSAPR